LPHKRDGPAPQRTTPGPGQIDERARLLPRLKFPRNTRARPTTPKNHRPRRRQEGPWRGFSVRLYVRPGTDGAHALYVLLRLAAQRFGLEVGEVREIREIR
jgi:hypothetical protein